MNNELINLKSPDASTENIANGFKPKMRSLEIWWKSSSFKNSPYYLHTLPDGAKLWTDKNGSQVLRSVDREREIVGKYLAELRNGSPEYYDQLLRISATHTMLPMSRDNRVSVIVPAFYEGPNLYKLLNIYTKQTKVGRDQRNIPLEGNLYEINILVNRTARMLSDSSVDEIERFKKENGHYLGLPTINYYDIEFDPPFNTVGNARRYLADVTLLRSIQRPIQDKPLYFETEDADLDYVDPHTVINVIYKFDTYPHLDALRGIQDRNPHDLMKNDWIFLKQRMWDFLEIVCRKIDYRPQNNEKWHGFWNRVITGGWNTAYTAEAIAIIGGYNPHKAIGEDTEIGEKLTRIRGRGTDDRLDVNLEVIGRVPSRSSSSIRRLLSERIRNIDRYKPVEFMDQEVNELIRANSVEKLLEHPLIKSVERISANNYSEFTDMIQRICETAYNLYAGAKIFKSVMFYAGFGLKDYKVRDGKVIILDWDNIKGKLESYRDKYQRTNSDVH